MNVTIEEVVEHLVKKHGFPILKYLGNGKYCIYSVIMSEADVIELYEQDVI